MEKQLRYKRTNKNLPLLSAFRKGDKWNSDQGHHHHHVAFLQAGSSWVAKVTWVACRKPQCKSSDNGRHVSIDPALGTFLKEFYFPVTVPCSALSVYAGHTYLLVPQMSVTWALRFTCRSTPGDIHWKHQRLGYITLHWEACPWVPRRKQRAQGDCSQGQNWGTVFTWWAVVTIQKCKAFSLCGD